MRAFKRLTSVLLLITVAVVLCFTVCSCKKKKAESGIYIVSKETFEANIKLNEEGNISEKFSSEFLINNDVDNVQDGKEYYALIYILDSYVYKGEIEFNSEAVPHLTLGNCYGMSSEMGLKLSLNGIGDGYDLKNYDKKTSKTTYCAAFSFIFNGFTGKETAAEDLLEIKLSYSASNSVNSGTVNISKSVQMRHEKQISASSSVKFLSLSDFQDGAADGSLKDTLEAPVFEKVYAVIDCALSGGQKIPVSKYYNIGANYEFN